MKHGYCLKTPTAYLRKMVIIFQWKIFRLIKKICSFFPFINWIKILGVPTGVVSIKDLEILEIFQDQKKKNILPKTIHGKVHGSFVPERLMPQTFVTCLIDGITTRRGYNFTRRGKLLLETSVEMHLDNYYPLWSEKINQDNYRYLNNFKFFPYIKKQSGTVVTLTEFWESNYYHWLFQVLPRMYLVERVGLRPDYLYVEYEQEFQKQSLEMMGYKKEQIINSRQYEILSPTNLIVPSVVGIPGIAPGWACEYLRETFLKQKLVKKHDFESYQKRIYISRASARCRKVENEEEVVNVLKKFEFQVIELETLSFIDQVNLFNSADIVIAPHGSGLSNIVFCRTGTKVIEIFSPEYVNPCYWYIGQECDLDYYYLIGDGDPFREREPGEGWFWDGMQCGKDISVDLDRLRKTLDSACSSKSLAVS